MSRSLDHSPARIAQQLLIDLLLGTAPAALAEWPVYATQEPDKPDNVLTVYNTQGTDDGRTMVDGEVQGFYGIQFRVRSRDEPSGWTKADVLWTAICQDVYGRGVTVGDTDYLVHSFAKIGDIISLGDNVPNSRRRLFTINALMQVKQV